MSKNVVVGILHKMTRKHDSYEISDPKYQAAHEKFAEMANQSGVDLYRVPLRAFDIETQTFPFAYDIQQEGWPRMDNPEVEFDVIWDRAAMEYAHFPSRFAMSQNWSMINDPQLTMQITEKTAPHLLFPELAVPTQIVRRKGDVRSAVEELHGDRIVVKPMVGSGGEGVLILSRDEANDFTPKAETNYILQEFVDSSAGVKDLVVGVHDLRIVFVGDRVSYSYLRVPKSGSLISNVAQGGTMIDVPPDQLPSEIQPAIKSILQRFEIFKNKLFTADFLFRDDGRPYLIEFNGSPGVYFQTEDEAVQERFYTDVLELFKVAAKH